MDSQERHDLKQNDLAEFMIHFRQWWRKNGTFWLLTILIAALAIFAYKYFAGRHTRYVDQALGEVALAQSPQSFFDIAQKYPDLPMVAAKARLDGANILLREAILGRSTNPNDISLSASDPQFAEKQMQRAGQKYESIIQAGEPKLIVMHARIGLAAIYETLRRFDDARAQYDAAHIQAVELKLTGEAAKIDRKIEDLARFQQRIVFADRPAAADALPDGSINPVLPGISDLPVLPELPTDIDTGFGNLVE
ncbi:MAG: hypothetical protein CMJ49_10995 [Planctomycetaceae bacterium]|nr:hypothetical protein [Planctomycetaceae bacterium]